MTIENIIKLNDFSFIRKIPQVEFYGYEYDGDKLEKLAKRYVAHEFNLLGSDWTTVHYGMMAKGFEGSNYSNMKMTYGTAVDSLPDFYREQSRRLNGLAATLVEGYIPIDWNIDFKSGYRYEMDYYENLKYGVVEGVDAKVPYDLSRCYHLVILGRAWHNTGDERYRKEIMAQILDWISMNPFEYGIGWNANMNVAIRLVNWITAFSFIRKGLKLEVCEEAEFAKVFMKSVLEHRCFISANLEFAETSIHPNHYIADIGGLLTGSMFCKNIDDDSNAWYRLALREIGLELDRQIGDDAFDYESTTSYHGFGLEMFIYPLIMAAKAEGCRTPSSILDWMEENLGKDRVKKIYKMFKALRDITQPDGLIPLIGDADNGRFLHLELPEHDGRDWRFLCCLGAGLFDDATLIPAGTGEEHYSALRMVFGDVNVKESCNGNIESKCYTDAGFYIMKSSDVYSMIFCGPIGTKGKGGHAHDDKLSLTLCIKGLEFFVDPGIYVYTANLQYRQAYRSVYSHNTVCLAGEPQNRYLEDSPWWGCHEDTKCKCLKWDDSAESTIFVGQHEGYTRLPSMVIHRRSVNLIKTDKRMEIRDEFISKKTGSSLPDMLFTFMLHPECDVIIEKENKVIVERSSVKVYISTDNGKWNIEEGFFSPAYGVRVDAPKLVVRLDKGIGENIINIEW